MNAKLKCSKCGAEIDTLNFGWGKWGWLWLALIFLPLQTVWAASLEEEARFLAAAKEAFTKKDVAALMAMTCWDRVKEERKHTTKHLFEMETKMNVTDVRLTDPDPTTPDEGYEDDDGVKYRSNLPVIKNLKIVFAKSAKGEMRNTYFVGEKDGKLWILQPAPVLGQSPPKPLQKDALEKYLAEQDALWKYLWELSPSKRAPNITAMGPADLKTVVGTWRAKGGKEPFAFDITLRLEANGNWSSECAEHEERPVKSQGRWYFCKGKIQLWDQLRQGEASPNANPQTFIFRSGAELRLFTVDDPRGYVPLVQKPQESGPRPKSSAPIAATSANPEQITPLTPQQLITKVPYSYYFEYRAQPDPGRRYWRRMTDSTWSETYPSGVKATFKVLGHTTVNGIEGTIVVKISGKESQTWTDNRGGLQAFIPDKGGEKMHHFYRNAARGDTKWHDLGPMLNVK